MKMWLDRWHFNPIDKKFENETLERRRCKNCALQFYNFHLPDSAKMYARMDKDGKYYPTTRPTYQIACDIIAKIKPQSVLEIGSGNGSFLEMLKPICPNAKGNEYNKAIAKKCRKRGLDISTKDISKIKERFDVVVSHEVLEHVFNTKEFFV